MGAVVSTEISEQEVRDFVTRWFNAVHSRMPLEQQRAFFAPGVGIETWAGITLPLEAQVELHNHVTEESHEFHWLKVNPLPDGRAHATADLRWQATKQTSTPGERRIRADCGEDWLIERGPDGQLRFARYLTSSMRYLPGSAELDLN